ncbi:MAG: VWA domain-containing protein [Lysinibacillus sp.]
MNEQTHTVTYDQTVWAATERQFERFNELLGLAWVLEEACREGEEIYPGFTNIMGDLWFAFYAMEPKLDLSSRERNDIQYDLIAGLVQTDEYMRTHILTASDALLSVLTAVLIGERLRDWLVEDMDVQEARLKKVRAEWTEGKARRQMEELRQTEQNPEAGEQERTQASLHREFVQKQLAYAQQDKEQAEKGLQDAVRKMTAQQLGDMLAATREEARRTKQAVLEIAALNGKKTEHLPVSEQFQLAEQIQQHDTLKKIAEMTGRFKRIAKKKMYTKQATMERKDVTLGQEVSRLLPAEVANLLMPDSKLDFLRRYAEQQTFVFDTKGTSRKGKGPIIICMDESSSMTPVMEESKAFCLALLMIAHRQKRDFAIIPFASDIGNVLIFPKGRATSEDIVDFSNRFLGGGTNYEKPLRASLDILDRSEFNEADILFVTDGSSFLSSRFLEEFHDMKKKRKFECTSIVLTNLINTVNMELVRSFSDKVIEVNELFEAGDAFSFY